MADYNLSDYTKTNFLEIKNTEDSNNSHIITNDLKRDIVVVISLNAGSGEFNETSYYRGVSGGNNYWQHQDWLSNAGNKGAIINLSKDSILIATADGGSGSLANILTRRQKRDRYVWKDGSGNDNFEGWHPWYDTYNKVTHNITREGQQDFKILIFNAESELKIDFIDNGARNTYKGSVSLSFNNRENVFGYHTIKG